MRLPACERWSTLELSECCIRRSSASKSLTVVPRSRLPGAPIAPAAASMASARLVLPAAAGPTSASVRIDSTAAPAPIAGLGMRLSPSATPARPARDARGTVPDDPITAATGKYGCGKASATGSWPLASAMLLQVAQHRHVADADRRDQRRRPGIAVHVDAGLDQDPRDLVLARLDRLDERALAEPRLPAGAGDERAHHLGCRVAHHDVERIDFAGAGTARAADELLPERRRRPGRVAAAAAPRPIGARALVEHRLDDLDRRRAALPHLVEREEPRRLRPALHRHELV